MVKFLLLTEDINMNIDIKRVKIFVTIPLDSVEKVREIYKISQDPVSLETPIGEEDDSHLGDFIEDKEVITPNEYASNELLKNELKEEDGILIVNGDDEKSISFKEKFVNNLSIGMNGSDIKINNYQIFPDHTIINFNYIEKQYNVVTNLTSKFNVYNYLFALATLVNLKFNIEDIIIKTKEIVAPKGRCETFKVRGGYAVIDYAHTPDGMKNVLNFVKSINKQNIITLFGCGGNRDKSKRKIMGEISTELSKFYNKDKKESTDIINCFLVNYILPKIFLR